MRTSLRVSRTPNMQSDLGLVPLFAHVVTTSALVVLLSIPVVTLPAAMVCGMRRFQRFVLGRPSDWQDLCADLRAACRALLLPTVGLLIVAGGGFLVLETAISRGIPGGEVIGPVAGVLAIGAAVILLRVLYAYAVLGAASARDAFRVARLRCTTDVRGSVWIAFAGVSLIVISFLVPLVALLAPGLLVLAVMAVESHRTTT